jgi:hypothetical protein
MPFYVWICAECEEGEQTFEHKMEPKAPDCPSGHGLMVRNWHGEAGRHIPGSAWPFTTKHLTGKEETFADQASLNRRLKELGLRQRDDAAFTEKRLEGYDWKTDSQKYSEGSGRGLPGCWV